MKRAATFGVTCILLAAAPLAGQTNPGVSPASAEPPAAATGGTGATGVTGAPSATGPEAGPRRAVPAAEASRVRQAAVDAFTRASVTRLRNVPDPKIDDYRLAGLSLALLRRLSPTDEQLARDELAAWTSAGDAARTDAAASAVLRLAPRDSVVLLRMLLSRIGRLQTADARLAEYERLLKLDVDPAVKSRLALDAALLLRDSGDDRGFLDRLTLAATLDVTNKEAAALFAAYYLERSTDARERTELLANVVLADPLDAAAVDNLTRELMRRGAFTAARRMLERLRDLRLAQGQQADQEYFEDFYIATWNARGADRALELIQQLQDQQARSAMRERDMAKERGDRPPPDRPNLLAAAIEFIRMGVHVSRGDSAKAARSAADAVAFNKLVEEVLKDPKQRGETVDDAEATRRIAELKAEDIFARLFAGVELDAVEADLRALEDGGAETTLGRSASDRFHGWLAAHRGETAKAEELLAPLAESDPQAGFALGLAAEKRENPALAAERYEKVWLAHPATVLGSTARALAARLKGAEARRPEGAEAAEAALAGFAPWLDRMTSDPRSFMRLEIEPVATNVGLLDRVEFRVRVRNLSRAPLGLGTRRPIPGLVLMSPGLYLDGTDRSGTVQPEVVDLQRRLRLLPDEEIVATIWIGKGLTGTALDASATQRATVRFRGLLGFQTDSNRRFQPGALGVEATSDIVTRAPADPRLPVEAIAARLRNDQGEAFAEALLMTSARLTARLRGVTVANPEQERTVLGAAMIERAGSLPDAEKALTVAIAARSGLMNRDSDLREKILDAAFGGPDAIDLAGIGPLSTLALLYFGFDRPDDPRLEAMLKHPDADTAECAAIIHRAVTATAAARAAEGGSAPAAPARSRGAAGPAGPTSPPAPGASPGAAPGTPR
ncbi:MAG: hypothetical protein IBJ11_04275 [Phycisphaerales bacterium]|nr:hypothetical protein [Phycisphaerales bacterium]